MERDKQEHVIRRLEELLRTARETMEQTKKLIKDANELTEGQDQTPNDTKPPDARP